MEDVAHFRGILHLGEGASHVLSLTYVDVFGSSGRYSPPGQLFIEMKMPRSQRITIEQIKEALEEIRRSHKRSRLHRIIIKKKLMLQKRSRPHRKIIKKKYNPLEVKSNPQEKDSENIISRRQVGPT
jgi:hypothetical protein